MIDRYTIEVKRNEHCGDRDEEFQVQMYENKPKYRQGLVFGHFSRSGANALRKLVRLANKALKGGSNGK